MAKCVAMFGEALVDDFGVEQVVGGAPFNAARNLAALGTPALMVTRIGDDGNGRLVRAEFERYGMVQSGLQLDAERPTGRVAVERSQRGHTFHILPGQAYDHIEAPPALAALMGAEPSVLYYGTLAQRDLASRSTLLDLLAASKATRYLDLNLREGQYTERTVYESLRHADILKVNEEELAALFGWYAESAPQGVRADDPQMREACARLIGKFALQAMVVTLGPRGAMYIGADGRLIREHGNEEPWKLVDTVGAGDAFSAVFLHGHVQGWDLVLTMARANAFAGAICSLSGAVPPDMAFYEPWLQRWQA
ncbi:PfkB family carbohydrate kinase [Massilia endophytica]|uniref:PfkB family carbohydrate kinase n=1 Tax=Massilia endophytica TaxID=2899220 RepID=UPI001E3300DA|nr:PfkB family carbohydrate kinase [Massilia endophytica]UGQ45996.1 PfkB family carbohydrate kinase [Massilia endophytica]